MSENHLYDKETDTYYTQTVVLPVHGVLIAEGVFLQRAPLKNQFDKKSFIFLFRNLSGWIVSYREIPTLEQHSKSLKNMRTVIFRQNGIILQSIIQNKPQIFSFKIEMEELI